MTLPRVNGSFGVVADPEVRFSASGAAVLSLRLVAKKRVRDSNGNWTDGPTPLFIDAAAFGKTAENLAESIMKGDNVVISGSLEAQEWTTPDGERRSKVAIVIDEVGVSTQWAPAKSARVLEMVPAAPQSEESPF